jgi:hypothetical protein
MLCPPREFLPEFRSRQDEPADEGEAPEPVGTLPEFWPMTPFPQWTFV